MRRVKLMMMCWPNEQADRRLLAGLSAKKTAAGDAVFGFIIGI